MRKLLSSALIVAVLATALINLSSCEKDEGKAPNISFKTGAGYISADDSVAAGTAFTVGINASKSEGEDVLKTLNISKTIDNGTAVTDTTYNIPSAQEDSYSGDWMRTAGAAGHREKWSFTVTNRDGITNTVSFTLSVN
jgi:hypothetical protein